MYLKHIFSQKSASKPVQAPQGYSAPYVGSGAPPSMYLTVPPYGSSLFNGAPIPPYDGPFSGGSAYHYNYGSRLSAGSPYRPLHLSGPAPYSSGSMMGNGMYCFCWHTFLLIFSIFFGELALNECVWWPHIYINSFRMAEMFICVWKYASLFLPLRPGSSDQGVLWEDLGIEQNVLWICSMLLLINNDDDDEMQAFFCNWKWLRGEHFYFIFGL